MKNLFLMFLMLQTLLSAKDEHIEIYGDLIQILIPASAYGATFYLDDTDGRTQFYKSFFSTFAATHILKNTTHEIRPDNSNDASFPSGHTSASFQGATFIHKRYGLKYAVPAYIGAAFVGYSRVYAEKHYTHDVLAGALIGSAFSWYFTDPFKVKGVEIKPIVFSSINTKYNMYGVSLTW